ncbi:MAG: response regulator [Gemmataceae bacterium]|nr:response regulator [Gemmataceae bacterium]
MSAAAPLATDFPPAKVLIADDHPQGAELIEAYLEGTGWDVKIATDGEETLRVVREWHPDVVLLDIMMPKLSGFEVCKRLRADATTKALPVLMITALDQASDVERAVEAGTHDFLTKPINKTDLVLRVRALLLSRGGATELDRTIEYVNTVARVGV